MHRYGNIDRICDMPWRVGVQMIRKASEMETMRASGKCGSPNCRTCRRKTLYRFQIIKINCSTLHQRKNNRPSKNRWPMCKLLNAAFGGEVVELKGQEIEGLDELIKAFFRTR